MGEEPSIDENLRPWHVVLHENDVNNLEQTITHLPYRFRALKPNPVGKLYLPNAFSLCQVSSRSSQKPVNDFYSSERSDDRNNVIEYTVKNTFIVVDIRTETSST